MAAPCKIVNSDGQPFGVKVSGRGQLVVAPYDFSVFYLGATAFNNVAVNVVPPVLGKCFIITDIVLSGDRSVGVNGAISDLYEANSESSGTIVKQIIQEEIAKQTRMALSGLNIIVQPGMWINIKSDDVIVRANVGGYYVPNIL